MLAILALTVSTPPVQAATTTNDLEHNLLGLINSARSERGLKPLRVGNRIWLIAGYRAGRMASTNVLSHSVAGSIASQLKAKGVPWYAYGEDIGYTRTKRGQTAIKDLFRMWKASPTHWRLMMSANYNYIGVGIAYRASNNKTFSSLVFTESRDLTGARAVMEGASHNGGDSTWVWRGWDPVLQTHTSGLKSYDVQTRVDSGSWHAAASRTTATKRSWNGLASGHTYGMRVRARDKAGNVGPWSSELRVRIP
jgi:Cysteine-rich secretory protein family